MPRSDYDRKHSLIMPRSDHDRKHSLIMPRSEMFSMIENFLGMIRDVFYQSLSWHDQKTSLIIGLSRKTMIRKHL